MLNGKVVLLTGGTGSFGKAFTKRALELDVKQLRIISRDELKQHEMAQEFNDPRVEYLLGDVRDAERLLLASEGCDIVIHAAAMKRIEKCERDPQEAIKTNINGSVNVMNACLKNNVKNAIFVSTDKACEPINLYGATKMVAEKCWIQANGYRGQLHTTRFSVVRYGNVLFSRGSVIPVFKKQAESGYIKLTNPEMTRYLIELDQAVDLVLIALDQAQGGEVYLPILRAASLKDIASAVDDTVEIRIVGQGSFEKLHEQLFNQSEVSRIRTEDGYMVVEPDKPTWPYRFCSFRHKDVPLTSKDSERFEITELRNRIHG